jgi:hypothetical protein
MPVNADPPGPEVSGVCLRLSAVRHCLGTEGHVSQPVSRVSRQSMCVEPRRYRQRRILLFTDEPPVIGFHATTVRRDCLARGRARTARRGQSHRRSSPSLKHRCGLSAVMRCASRIAAGPPGSELSRAQGHDHPRLPTERREVESHAQRQTAVRRHGQNLSFCSERRMRVSARPA